MRILGLDPGKASGIAVYATEGVVLHMEEAQAGVKGFPAALKWAVHVLKPDHIVCEKFDLRPGNKFLADLTPVECIGWLKGEGYGVQYVTPAQHKALVKDSVLTPMMKAAGFPVGAGHTRDALRTAVWFAAMKLKHKPTLELLKPKDK